MGPPVRLFYLDLVRGVAVAAMVLAHVVDSWTHEAYRHASPFYTTYFIGGIASPLFLLLAGLAGGLSATGKARRAGSLRAGAAAVRARGWELFALALVFRLQSQLLGWGALDNLLKVDVLNAMGLALVGAFGLWPWAKSRASRVWMFAAAATAIAMLTPLVRAASWPAALPDPLEAYLRPVGQLAAFPLFPWAGFVFAGVIVGELVDAARESPRRESWLHAGLAATTLAGVWVAWQASFQPALFPTARFWHDSPTFFFIRLGLSAACVPIVWAVARVIPHLVLAPFATFGRASLFVYWIHVEMVYGVIAEPLKRQLPLWQSVTATALLLLGLYWLVRLKNQLLETYGLRGPLRLLAPVLR
jgi:uncharacterized membrane protein